MVARQKKEENIVEYVLYMWQIEDLLRACGADMDIVKKRIVTQYSQPEDVMEEIHQWYASLCKMMRDEGVTEKGHIKIISDVVAELQELHGKLLKTPNEQVYEGLYYQALPDIVQLRAKSGGEAMSEIETCLTGVYGFLLLMMQGKEITPETSDAIHRITTMLSFLASKYHANINVSDN